MKNARAMHSEGMRRRHAQKDMETRSTLQAVALLGRHGVARYRGLKAIACQIELKKDDSGDSTAKTTFAQGPVWSHKLTLI